MTKTTGFPPLARADARWLILGSMPSTASIAAGQYYGHPRNHFWRLMGELIDAGPALDYHDRVQRLLAQRIAVWDVFAHCQRPGSLDSAIDPASEVANDFHTFFTHTCPQIEAIYFNGRKAEASYSRHVLPNLAEAEARILRQALPSTSPAMAAKSFAEKLAEWSLIPCG